MLHYVGYLFNGEMTGTSGIFAIPIIEKILIFEAKMHDIARQRSLQKLIRDITNKEKCFTI